MLSRKLRAAASRFKYLLRAIFANAADQTFVDGQVLDTTAEGILDGQLSVKDAIGGLNSIVNGAFRMVGTSGWGSKGLYSEAINREEGRGLFFEVDINDSITADCMFSFSTDQTLALASVKNALYFQGSGSTIVAYNGSFFNLGKVFNSALVYQVALILDTVGIHIFIKQAAEYPTWTYFGQWLTDTTSVLYATLSTDTAGITDFPHYKSMIIPDTLYIEQITPLFYDEFDGPAGSFDASRVPNEGSYLVATNSQLDGSGYAYGTVDGVDSLLIFFRGGEAEFTEFVINFVGLSTSTTRVFHYLRYAGSTSIIRCIYYNNFQQLTKRHSGGTLVLDSDTQPMAINTDYNVKTSDDNSEINIYLNEVLILNAVEPDFANGTQTRLFLKRATASNYAKCNRWKIWNKTGYTFEGVDG